MVVAAIVLVIVAVALLIIGTSLFLGEWLLGSIGWGVVHGVLACLAVAMTLVLAGLGISARRLVRSFAIAVILGVVVGLVLGSNVLNKIYAAIRDAVGVSVEPGTAPLVVGAVLIGLVGLIVGIILAARTAKTTGSRVGIVLGTTFLGALTGAFTAITFNAQVAAGIGITVTYVAWMVVMGMDVARTGIDFEALKTRFTPTQTIATSKETLEWLQRRMPPGIG